MNNLETNTPSIYVACLSSYSAGTLRGAWINATQTKEEILDEIDEMLTGSNEEPAEEWAIHDYSGFEGAGLSEWESIETITALANLMHTHGGLAARVYGACDENIEETREALEECYQGCYRDIEDWAHDFMNETMDIPAYLKNYVDYRAFARDTELGGDIFTVESEGKTHVFWSR